jgi:hypothetical protein
MGAVLRRTCVDPIICVVQARPSLGRLDVWIQMINVILPFRLSGSLRTLSFWPGSCPWRGVEGSSHQQIILEASNAIVWASNAGLQRGIVSIQYVLAELEYDSLDELFASMLYRPTGLSRLIVLFAPLRSRAASSPPNSLLSLCSLHKSTILAAGGSYTKGRHWTCHFAPLANDPNPRVLATRKTRAHRGPSPQDKARPQSV